MKRIPSIKSVMTPFPHSIEIDESLTKASSIMAEHDTRHLIVTDKGKLAGVITDGDIKLALGPGLSTESELLVRDLCVSEVYAVELTAPLDTVLLDMAEKHIGSALVLKEGKLVGIFTTTDACRRFGEFLRTLFPAGGDDAA